MSALPEDLRAVMKPMTIYTDNIGDSNKGAASSITSSIDYLPLLAEYEIKGKILYSNTYEQGYQKQYPYYALGNSQIKYKHNDLNSESRWLLRSPAFISTRSSQWNCNDDYVYTANLGGLAPVFRV